MAVTFTRVKMKGNLPVRKSTLGVINENTAVTLPSLIITSKKTFPGDFALDDFDGTTDDSGTTDIFSSSGFDTIYFNTISSNGWFRNKGSTTT
jgi:hypothetical protein